MSDEPLTHIKRTQLPWREDEGLTECGRDASGYMSVSRDEAVAQFKKLGQQRFALVMCMTCVTGADVRYRPEVDAEILHVLGREINRVKWREQNDRKRLENEFAAIVKLINAHRNEFDECLRAQDAAADLTAFRNQRARAK